MNRYGKRALAVGLLLALGIAGGVWWVRGGAEELDSPEELTALLPPAGSGRFLTKEVGPIEVSAVQASMEQCGPVPVVQKFRTRAPAGFVRYGVGETSVDVAVVRLADEDVGPVGAALRSSTHCERSGPDNTETWWTKVDHPWFGDAAALFRVADSNVAGEPLLNGGPVWSFTTSGEWLVAVGAYRATVDGAAQIYRELLSGWDREVGTHFLAPGRSRSDCGSPELPVGALTDEAAAALATVHDMACRGQAELVGAMQSAPLVVDSGFADDPGAVDIGDPGEFARLLESPAVHRNGALSFRRGDTAAVFSTVRSGGLAGIGWDAHVQHCSAAAPVAARMCGPDPNGPLGGADWPSLAAEAGCASDMYPFGPISHALFEDLTGDGRQEAVIALLCDTEDGSELGEVRVYDGASSPDSPRLLQSLLRDDPGPFGTGLLPVALTTDGSDLVVESHAWQEFVYPVDPDARVRDRYRWQGGGLALVGREVR